jgi:hypothetical protein
VSDIPPEVHVAYQKAFWDRMKSFGYGYSDPVWHSLNAALEAAAPLLAAEVARKILAHADDRWPSGCIGSQPARRHFRTAAQIAGLAFYTEEDIKRIAAEAIAAGNVAWCGVPEAGENESAQAAPTGEDWEHGTGQS